MNRRNKLGTALVVLAVVLFTVPVFFPVQPLLVHDTDYMAQAPVGPAQEESNVPVVAYENLSDRGKELYRTALENGGEHSVPQDQGAPEFDYPTAEEMAQAREDRDESRPGGVFILRPEDDSHLPPSRNSYFGPEREEDSGGNEDANITKLRQKAQRYDFMVTSTEEPPLGATSQLIRLAAVLLAVLSLGLGGYFLSSK